MNLTKLDTIFSEFIRLRDSIEDGICRCISCGKTDHYKKMDAGHFINRKHLSLRFSEVNVNAQCRSCNRFDEGNFEGYRRGLIKKYGPEIIEKLYALKNLSQKFTKFEIDASVKYYKEKVKLLKKEKGL